jgi:surfactin synthase thioesterase subunit
MRTLVLLPGMDGSALMFRPLVEAAPEDVEVVPVSYPPGKANSY